LRLHASAQLPIATSAAPISSIKLERTACLGTCPIYSVTIFSDGRLEYKGEMFVKAKGIHQETAAKEWDRAMRRAYR
jgi:Domain of unknown function (DUF6438)